MDNSAPGVSISCSSDACVIGVDWRCAATILNELPTRCDGQANIAGKKQACATRVRATNQTGAMVDRVHTFAMCIENILLLSNTVHPSLERRQNHELVVICHMACTLGRLQRPSLL